MTHHAPVADQFHILSFEGPDPYASAGGIATRVTGLAEAIAEAGGEVHLWFVGAPELPGHEERNGVRLHRWCQWISAYHPDGVYDGEEGKWRDYASSLPPFLLREVLLPHLAKPGARAFVLAEEWHTADAVLRLDALLRREGVRGRVRMLWNANNTFGFDRIDWPRLTASSRLTTVSRYMRFRMTSMGVDPLVIPNGLAPDAFDGPSAQAVRGFTALLGDRLVLAKVARWDPDKRWLLAVETTAKLKREGARPLLVARGGVEAHGLEVRRRATASGLRVLDRTLTSPGRRGLLRALGVGPYADVIVVNTTLDPDAKKLLFHASAAVLAHSGHEPFGLVGLETMAVAGLACTGATGEDYVVPGWNALQLQSTEPTEFVWQMLRLRREPSLERALRTNGLATARGFAWPRVLSGFLFPSLGIGPPELPPGSVDRAAIRGHASMWRRAGYPGGPVRPRHLRPRASGSEETGRSSTASPHATSDASQGAPT